MKKLPFDLSRQNKVLCSLIILISNACPALKIGREFSQKSFQNFFYFWISAEVSQLFESWTEKLVPSFLFKLQPKMEEERLVTTDGWLGDCLKVKCLRSEASLHLLSFTFEFFTSFWCRFVFVQPLDNNQIYEEFYKQEIYRVNLNKKNCVSF